MKRDVQKLMKRFDYKHRPKVGDLVITAEVKRVVKIERDYDYGGNVLVVVDVDCQTCAKFKRTKRGKKSLKGAECGHEHFVWWGGFGQHKVMRLKD